MGDDSVRVSGALQESQNQIEKALDYTWEWRLTAKVYECAVLACKENRTNSADFE